MAGSLRAGFDRSRFHNPDSVGLGRLDGAGLLRRWRSGGLIIDKFPPGELAAAGYSFTEIINASINDSSFPPNFRAIALAGASAQDFFDAPVPLEAVITFFTPAELEAAGYVVNGPPVASTATYTRAAGTSLKIKITALLATSTSDPDEDARSLESVGVSVGGAGVAISGAWILYSPANSSDDSFSYTINDGHSHPVTGTIRVLVVNPAGATVNFVIKDGKPTMQFAGIPGYTYTIQRTPDLDIWTDLTILEAPLNGVFNFTDNNPLAGGAFYRLSYTPDPT